MAMHGIDSGMTQASLQDLQHISEDYVQQAGVVGVQDFLVSTGSGMTLNIAGGRAYILNSSWSLNNVTQNKYFQVTSDNSPQNTVTIASNGSANPRITSVFVRKNTNSPDATASNTREFFTVDGAAAASPVAPATPTNALRLADVTVPSGAASITSGNITDRRAYATVSGPIDGWVAFPSGSYTRSATTQFTGPTGVDFTRFLNQGDKLRYLESATGTLKYAYVVGVSNVGVTLFSGTDHGGGLAVGNNPTQIFYSKSERATGFPDQGFNFTPTYSASGSMTYTSVTTTLALCAIEGRTVYISLSASGTTGGTAAPILQIATPFTALSTSGVFTSSGTADGGTTGLGHGFLVTTSIIGVRKFDATNYGLGAGRTMNLARFAYVMA